jgi:ABC-type multidrug transport system ATPase subunit
MFRKDIYLIALEILIETIVNHQKQRETFPNLEKLCVSLDRFFNTSQFTDILSTKISFYKKLLINEDESLFVSDTHIPHLVKTEKLILEFDKLNVVLIIKSWTQEYEFSNKLIYNKIGIHLGLESQLLNHLYHFCEDNNEIQKSDNYLIISPGSDDAKDSLEGEWVEENKHLVQEIRTQLNSQPVSKDIQIFHLTYFNIFILKIKEGSLPRLLKNGYLCPDNFCIIQFGDSISINNEIRISFADLKKKFVEKKYENKFILAALHAEFTSSKAKGLKPFNFVGSPGELIGILGNEGVGKSTMLKILSGAEKIKNGKVTINGYDIFKFRYQLSGIIGYVPEEDLLYYNLTAKENLEIAAQLYIHNIKHSEVEILVDNLFNEIELNEIKNITVGKPSQKYIQPGQRRLLNIALELIRDPQILIIDNAVSSLSLNDSSKVIKILSKYTFKGKLIITTITQTSNSTFEFFDKLYIINNEGYPVYAGPRQEAIPYFMEFLPEGIKRTIQSTGGYEPEIILDLLSRKKSEARQDYDQKKYLDGLELYRKNIAATTDNVLEAQKKSKIPGTNTIPPKLEKQYLIYTYRNIKNKLVRKQELIYTIITAPIIGILTALVLRTSDSTQYYFGLNPNVPVFIYLSLIINFFNGIAQAALEIFKEKHVLRKEEFLHLSLFSYINSKITVLILVILVQTFLYTYITNSILGKDGMLFYDWIIYFSSSIFGALTGLILSSIHRNIDSILLRSIPIILFFLLIMGGEWINFKNFTKTNGKYTPLLSELAITRWGYEALMVQQYARNNFQKEFYESERKISTGTFHSYHSIPKLKEWLNYVLETTEYQNDSVQKLKRIISNQFKYYELTEDVYPFEFSGEFLSGNKEDVYIEAIDYLSYLDYFFIKKYNEGLKRKKQKLDSLRSLWGNSVFEEHKLKHYNNYVAGKVKNSSTRESYKIINEALVQLSDPIYQNAENDLGRAIMFSPEKRFNGQIIKTFEFNLSMIWLFNFIMYVFLITDLLNRVIQLLKVNRHS